MDAIVLAGDHKKNIKIYGDNKGFLLINNTPLVIHVISKILNVPQIDNIFIVGPKLRLDDILKKYKHNLPKNNKKITTVEQRDSLMQNAWEGYLQSIPEYADGSLTIEQIKNKYSDKEALFLPIDIPLVMTEEISYFILQCDLKTYDYYAGITPEDVMNIYYPTKISPGIAMVYLHFKENLYRVSNIHLLKPFKIKRLKYVGRMYNIRYQKKLINMLRFIRYVFDAPNTTEICKYYIIMQLALFSTRFNLKILSDFFRKYAIKKEIEKTLSTLIGAKIKSIEIPFGGIAIDVDNEPDFKILNSQFLFWKEKQLSYYQKWLNKSNS